MNNLFSKSFFVAVITGLGACSVSVPSEDYKPQVNNPDFLHRSVKQITDVIVHDIFSPPVSSRIYLYITVAGYEAAVHDDKNYVSLAGQLNGLEKVPEPEEGKEYCFPLSSVVAMLHVGKALIFSEDKVDG